MVFVPPSYLMVFKSLTCFQPMHSCWQSLCFKPMWLIAWNIFQNYWFTQRCKLSVDILTNLFQGTCSVELPASNETYTWSNVNCVVHIIGTMWMEHQVIWPYWWLWLWFCRLYKAPSLFLLTGHDGDHEPDDEAALRAVFQAGRLVLRRQRPPRRRGLHRRPTEEQAQVSSETQYNLISTFESRFLHFLCKQQVVSIQR